MQAIVADTTPLNYLVLIQAADILPNLYRRVLIPPAVKAELAHANTPAIVRAWISQAPPWLEVVSLKSFSDQRNCQTSGPSLRLTNARLPRCIVILLRHSLAQKNLRISPCGVGRKAGK